jgi:hypothetical protein
MDRVLIPTLGTFDENIHASGLPDVANIIRHFATPCEFK